MKFFTWLFSIFSSKKENTALLIEEQSKDQILLMKKKDRSKEIISASQDKIKNLNELVKLSRGTKYHEKFLSVLEKTQEIHDKITSDDKISINKLEQFHLYFTEQFINTFDEALHDLRPKKSLEESLKASFKLQDEINEEQRVKREEKLISSVVLLGIKERIEILVNTLNDKWKLIQEKEYNDVVETDTTKNIVVTYADKYTNYLINNYNLSKNIKFIGELNDKKETPIVYDINTLDVFKILYDNKQPEKIGDVKDDSVKELVLNMVQTNKKSEVVESLLKMSI
jgi:hypothetical protein